jgi:hypothetical protein
MLSRIPHRDLESLTHPRPRLQRARHRPPTVPPLSVHQDRRRRARLAVQAPSPRTASSASCCRSRTGSGRRAASRAAVSGNDGDAQHHAPTPVRRRRAPTALAPDVPATPHRPTPMPAPPGTGAPVGDVDRLHPIGRTCRARTTIRKRSKSRSEPHAARQVDLPAAGPGANKLQRRPGSCPSGRGPIAAQEVAQQAGSQVRMIGVEDGRGQA